MSAFAPETWWFSLTEACVSSACEEAAASGRAARLGGEAAVDDLEFAHDLQGERGARCACVLLGVVHAVDRERVAAGTEPSEAEPAVRQWSGALCVAGGRCHPGRKQDEAQIV